MLAAVASLLPVSGAVAQTATPASLYHLSKAVPIGAPDRWDYVLYENTAHRVYVAHGTSIDVLDGGSGAKIGEVPVPGANGVAVVPGIGKGYAGSRTNQTVIVSDLASFKDPEDCADWRRLRRSGLRSCVEACICDGGRPSQGGRNRHRHGYSGW